MVRVMSNNITTVTYTKRYLDGTVNTESDQHVISYAYKDDIKKTTPDKRGFRRPTSYKSFFTRNAASYGNYAVKYGLADLQTYLVYGSASTAEALNPQYFGTIGSGTSRIPDIPPSVKARARTELLLKMKKGDFNAAVFLGEAGKSIKMISEAVETIREAYIGVKRGDFVRVARNVFKSRNWRWVAERAKQRASRSGDAWLAYTYGWKPLVYDIWNAVQLIQQGWKPEHGPILSAKRRISWNESYYPSTSLKGTSWNGTHTRGFEACCYYTVSNEWLAGLNNIGLINPFTVAWELMPYSFVIDWLLPIGNFLEALTADVGLAFYGGYETSYVHTRGTLEYYVVVSSYKHYTGTPFKLAVNTTGMSRTALTDFVNPSPFYLGSGLNATRALSSIALLSQRWR